MLRWIDAPGMEEALNQAGIETYCMGDVRMCHPPERASEAQAMIDAYTVHRAVDWFATHRIKPWTEAVILARYSPAKQHSLNQERVDLLLAGETDSARMTELQSARAWIAGMVAWSNALEASMRTKDMPALLAAVVDWQAGAPI